MSTACSGVSDAPGAPASSTSAARPVCLLLHGLGGEPFEMRELARTFEEAGYHVEVPLLPGHGLSADDFAQSSYEDWLAGARQAYRNLAAPDGGTDRVVLVGFSMGGVLCLELAAEMPPAAVVCISVPLYPYYLWPPNKVKDWRLYFMPLLAKFITVVKHRGTPSTTSRRMAPWQGHEGAYFLRPLASFARACKKLRRELHRVKAPLLLMHDRNDSIAAFSNVFEIAGRCTSRHIEIRAFELRENVTSKHMLVTHEQSKHLVCEYSVDFLKRSGAAVTGE